MGGKEGIPRGQELNVVGVLGGVVQEVGDQAVELVGRLLEDEIRGIVESKNPTPKGSFIVLSEEVDGLLPAGAALGEGRAMGEVLAIGAVMEVEGPKEVIGLPLFGVGLVKDALGGR